MATTGKHCQRSAKRIAVEAAVLCRPYASTAGCHAVDGIMRNFSSQGIYIEAHRKFEPGSILVVRMIRLGDSSRKMVASYPRTICLGEVKWLKKNSDSQPIRYGMGIRYLD
ncbi:PilZ domain-containing protein [uncultured Desulfosarcina sp.]|uniref:PilZ domain-containing protein n=1 Tax=uncultured Desulfosarcina sp. TaxID=218289 RepID=UPI0029C91244|nr:PilZ domain-containing protein [uncultured Desulfosarcina sp.]